MSSNQTDTLFIVYPREFAGFIVFIVGLSGLSANFIVAVFTNRLKSMNNPYGRLAASQSLAEVVLCFGFTFYFAPLIAIENQWLQNNSNHMGFIMLIFYDVCIWSHLFIALNRFIAITFPINYDILFCRRNTHICIFLSWLIAFVTAICLYKLSSCDFFYSPKVWAFVFTNGEVCDFISWTIDFHKDIIIVMVIALVDSMSIFNVHKIEARVGPQMSQTRKKREINFLRQAILQGFFFATELLTYFIFAWKFQNIWAIWSLTTLAWSTVHLADGCIIIFSNQEFRKLLVNPLITLTKTTNNSNGTGNDGRIEPQ